MTRVLTALAETPICQMSKFGKNDSEKKSNGKRGDFLKNGTTSDTGGAS